MYFFIVGLEALGPQLVKLYIVPRVKMISSRVDGVLEKPSSSNADKIAANQIKNQLIVKWYPYIFRSVITYLLV